MTEPDGPRKRDDVYFGPEPRAGDQTPNALLPDGSHPPVDAWFNEEPEADQQAPLFEWALTAMDRHRTSALVGLGSITVIALVVAALGWATDRPATVNAKPQSGNESHGLTADQAACFALGRIEGRVAAVLGEEGTIGLGPTRPFLGTEIASLDGLGAAYPAADYRLIVAFADVANASVRMSNGSSDKTYRRLVVERATAVEKVHGACREIASFDIDTSSPLGSGDHD